MNQKSRLIKQADKLYSIHRIKQVGKCERCNKKYTLSLCHIITRGNKKLRYENRNTLVLCYICHTNFHSYPLIFTEFIKCLKGEETYKWLIRESNILKPLSKDFYKEIIEQYK